ncbi:MAG: D-glycero-beta-D-manno-heptose-7-phosphate kinase [Alphaproteobacteria bacterium]|nr:D-glycero-beta-D-manno-heptose-7-phosphate kinase [Alphaproteobacteria bacterium]
MTERSDLAQRVADFAKARILCVGDVMLDRYIYGTVDRISPEAPIPILSVTREMAMLGGAGNVVRNLAALKASCCFVSLIGEDPAGREVTQLIAAEPSVEPNLLPEPDRVTTIKVRYVAGSQQLLRADRETVRPAKPTTESELVRRAGDDLKHCQSVVLSDYGKGVLSDDVIGRIIAAARAQGRPVVVDPRGNDPRRYAGATVITPNRRELGELAGRRIGTADQIREAAHEVMGQGAIEAVLVTLSQDGMALFTASGEEHHFRAEALEVYDVSGAGDTVVAVVACALASGLSLADAARLASVAAGIVVGKIGTAVVHPEELVFALRAEDLRFSEAKAATMEQALERVATWRRQGFRIGFTNGCFDLLHPGHVSLLGQARTRCDKLIVGLNSDASVARLKGPDRPVQSEAARAAVLGSLASVDLVVVFGEDTPLEIIRALKPDLLVKGADYTVDAVVGADVVQAYGGQVYLAELAEGHSTSNVIRRMAGKG